MACSHYHARKQPSHGVKELPDRTTVVFVTVCTQQHASWLADARIHTLLRTVWHDARGWLVGPYLVMPDHLHFFVCPGDLDCSLERWQRYWKRHFGERLNDATLRFQIDHWDTRIRNARHFTERWAYVQQNPVRKGLVARPEDWPFQGVIHEWTYLGP